MAPATSEPLCLRPMTYGDARYVEGRRAGLLEAVEHLEGFAREKVDVRLCSAHAVLRDLYRVIAAELQAKAGEP